MDTQIISFLKEFNLFKDLDAHEIDKICSVGKIIEKDSNEIIFREGEEGEEIFIILSGEVEVSQSLKFKKAEEDLEIRDKILTKLNAEQKIFFGEVALLGVNKRTATCITKTPCKFMVLEREKVSQILSEDYNLAYRFMKNIAGVLMDRLQKANMDVVKLSTALMLALGE